MAIELAGSYTARNDVIGAVDDGACRYAKSFSGDDLVTIEALQSNDDDQAAKESLGDLRWLLYAPKGSRRTLHDCVTPRNAGSYQSHASSHD